MGLGSEETVGPELFEVKKGKRVAFGGREGLPEKFLELSLNKQGNLRVIRLEGANRVRVWGQDERQNFAWVNWQLVQQLPEKVYERIDGRSVIIDIDVPSDKEPNKLLRLNDAKSTKDSRIFRVEVNPPIRDLGKRN